MKKRLAISGVALAVIAIGIVAYWWFRTPELVRCYSRITGPMTLTQVRDVMGREEDPPDPRRTTTGEFERSWSFSDGGRITVVFDPNGNSRYKEIAPCECGVTPLMGKYIDQ